MWLQVDSEKASVFLRGPQGTIWTVFNKEQVQFMVSAHLHALLLHTDVDLLQQRSNHVLLFLSIV